MRPVVLICLDGMGPDYVEAAFARGAWSGTRAWSDAGYRGVVDAVLPTFTNPNNLSLVTGETPDVHGIGGNHFYDAARGVQVQLDDPRYLRAPTLLAAEEARGQRVVSVTAKDKLRRFLGAGRSGPSFSVERAAELAFPNAGLGRLDELVGRPAPPIYSGEASLYVLEAGVSLLEGGHADLLYLSTTDYLQHRHGPGAAELSSFLEALDLSMTSLVELGALVAVTADHGMSDKPNILFLEELVPGARVVLPITDPYVRHHGALGGCAFVDDPDPDAARERIASHPGVAEVLPRAEAALRYRLPSDRIGDLVVFGTESWALGSAPDAHDLSALEGPLRSHGSFAEKRVPVLLSERPVREPTASRELLPLCLQS